MQGIHILQKIIREINPTHLLEVKNERMPLFDGAQMEHLSEIKQMFAHQNKHHNWCDDKYSYTTANDDDDDGNDNSLIGSMWKRLNDHDEFAIKETKNLSAKQKEWSKYLHHLVDLKFELE